MQKPGLFARLKLLKAAFQPNFSDVLLSNYPQSMPTWLDVDVRSLMEKGYKGNVYVYAAIRNIVTKCASIPWTTYQIKNEKKLSTYRQLTKAGRLAGAARQLKAETLEEVTTHPLVDFLKRPNGLQDWSHFIETTMGYKLISGNSFLIGYGPETGQNAGRFLEAYPFRADQVEIVAPPYPMPVTGYRVNGKEPILQAGRVLHMKYFDPIYPRVGLSPIEAAIQQVTQANAYAAWNTSLVQNMARIPGALKVKVKNLTEEQANKIMMKFMERNAGAEKAGLPIVFGEEMEWQEMGFKPTDLDWTAGLELTGAQIALAYETPPELLGDSKHKTYNSIPEAIRYFYMGKIIPEMDALRDGLNSWLTAGYNEQGGRQYFLDYNLEDIEVLQEERTALHDRTTKEWLAGLVTKNEAREILGLEAVEGGDFYLLPVGAQPFTDEEAGNWAAPAPAGTEEEFQKAVAELLAAHALDYAVKGNGH